MTKYNLTSDEAISTIYQNGWLPQRNKKGLFYSESSCRSNLKEMVLSSENRRIINKTSEYEYEIISSEKFDYSVEIQKNIFGWIKELGWDFPISSVKTIFKDHLFNKIYVWKYHGKDVAYGVVYEDGSISHIAYVFYDPSHARTNLPIRMVLQVVVDSQQNGCEYCYLGRFSKESGFYKRNMPGFEYYDNNSWIKYVG